MQVGDLLRNEPVVIKALVASNTDIAEAILDAILSRPDEGFRLFCLCHNASPLHHVAGSLVELQLHLPKKRLTSQSRCGLVLTLHLPAEELCEVSRFLGR